MPMTYKLQKYKEIAMALLKTLYKYFSLFIGLFFPASEPLLLHLVRCDPFAVEYHGFTGHTSHLKQPRLVNKSRLLTILF
jgi:hypothetical protein